MWFKDISLVQSLSHDRLFAIPWTAACQASLSVTNSRSLLKLMSIKLVMPSNHLILCQRIQRYRQEQLLWLRKLSKRHSSSPLKGRILVVCVGFQFSSVQLLSHVWLFVTPWTAACQASLSITNSWSPPKPMSIELVMLSNHLILCCLLFLPPSIFPSIRVFSNESALRIRWPKYSSFSFNIGPSNEHPGLISFRMDWLDLLAVQGTLKNLLQHHSSKASIFRHSSFLHRPTLTSVRDHWKNHSLDKTDPCWQSNVSAF